MTAAPLNRVVARILRSPAHRLLSKSVCLIQVTGVKSGNHYRLPVQYVETSAGLVVWPGHAQRKTWWRNLRQPAPITVWLRGERTDGQGAVVMPGDTGYAEAREAYCRRWRRVTVPDDEPLVRIAL